MARTVRVRVKGGLLEPREDLDLAEGQEVTVTILSIPSKPDVQAFQRAAGAWKGTLDPGELIRNICADRLLATRPTPQL